MAGGTDAHPGTAVRVRLQDGAQGDEAVKPRSRWSFGLSSVLGVLILAVGTVVAVPRLAEWIPGKSAVPEGLATASVRRSDMNVTLTTGGRVDTSERTVIECELERLEVSVRGQELTGGGASTVISVVPDGTMVKKGDVLCELDASEYVEMLRQQKMTVKRVQADHRQAELDLDVARMAVTEFKEGVLVEALKELKGVIVLNESAWQRSRDRLKWAYRMLDKGYVPASQYTSEQFNERRASILLQQSRTELAVFQEFTAPRALRVLQANVLSAETLLNYQDRRLQRHQERQAMLEQQVTRCTIRAPHDGFIIYANDEQRALKVEEGMVVHQKQDLFYLPNLSKMVVTALVHESVANRVRAGMRTWIRVEGVPGQVLDGHVVAVAQLPTQNYLNDVRYFTTTIAFDTIPPGLLPGMTAEVEIATQERQDVLAIPIEALAVEEGEDYCYVVSDDGVERREIEIGQSTANLLEVTLGLEEGEHVVLHPVAFDNQLETLSPFHSPSEARWGGVGSGTGSDTGAGGD
jgi:HlyD family secretion protein